MASTEEGVISLGPWGGQEGDSWIFNPLKEITKISIFYDNESIVSLYMEDASGQNAQFGGNTGEEEKINIQSPLEYLISISGTYGATNAGMVITSLSFITNLSTYGPFGNLMGDPISIPIKESFVKGFFGSARSHINAIGILVRPLKSQGVISLGPWGGHGGQTWTYQPNSDISEIFIDIDSYVKDLTFKEVSGLVSGGKNRQDSGKRYDVQIAVPSEFLISISGTCATYATDKLIISSISFITNLNTYGPFGNTSDTSFSIPISNSKIVGFFGTKGDYIHAIGMFVKPASSKNNL